MSRTERIYIRVSERERKWFRSKAKTRNRTISDYMRLLVEQDNPQQIPTKESILNCTRTACDLLSRLRLFPPNSSEIDGYLNELLTVIQQIEQEVKGA